MNEIPAGRKFLLWDSSVVVGYYLPKVTSNQKAAARARVILDAVRNHRVDAFCYIPSIVIAEVFNAFNRECFSSWDRVVYKKYGGEGRSLHKKTFRNVCDRFKRDIHNGALFYQYDLNRYHVLALDLIAPVDKHRKFYRAKNTRSMGASDLLVGAIGIHLTKIAGRSNTAILTADRRMEAIFANACPNLNENTAAKLGLKEKARELGFGDWCPDIYPQVIDLQRCSEQTLRSFFESWPLKTRKTRGREPKA